MVRNYKRKTSRGEWSEEAMKLAVEDVEKNVKKLREAARAYNIPVMTLSDRIRSGNTRKKNLGRNTTFTEEQEKEIAEQVLLMAKMFYGISSIELRRLVFEYAETNKIPNNFCKTSRLAGKDWLSGFLNRQKTISVRKPEPTSISRITAFNKTEVDLFFSNLQSEVEKHKFPPSRIYNFDETGISTVQKPRKILGPKGTKQVGAATSWERGKNITVGCAMSAAGDYIPPIFIYPRKRMTHLLARGGPPDAIYHCSPNGWITEELFIVWLKHFISYVKPSRESPALLIMDNHKTHTTLAAYRIFKENGIVVVTLPPHCSHRLQPLDLTFYSSLKAAFNKECDNFLRMHPNEKITPYDIAAIFKNAYVKVANIEKGVSGFAAAGIFPLDPDKFKEEDFAVRSVVEQRLPVVEDNEKEKENKAPAPIEDNPVPSTSKVLSFKNICPTPVYKTVTPSARQQHSIIFTQSPNGEKLEESAVVKGLKEKVKKLKTKIKEEKLNKPNKKGKGKLKTKSKMEISRKLKAGVKEDCRRRISFDSSSSD